MRKLLVFLALGVACMADAQETNLGMFMQGAKIGWTSYSTVPSKLNGVSVTRSDSKTRLDAGLLGTAMQISIDSTTWTSTIGRPVKMTFLMSSAGRDQRVDAVFGVKDVKLD